MTPEEKKAMQERLEAATKLESRVHNLTDALKRIDEKQIARVSIPLNENSYSGSAIEYGSIFTNKGGVMLYHEVCWASKEVGLKEELIQAVRDILERRLKAAQEDYERA